MTDGTKRGDQLPNAEEKGEWSVPVLSEIGASYDDIGFGNMPPNGDGGAGTGPGTFFES
ncbi:MAG: hypothetical protein AAF494_04280 [Pseudomonadota bacterium]